MSMFAVAIIEGTSCRAQRDASSADERSGGNHDQEAREGICGVVLTPEERTGDNHAQGDLVVKSLRILGDGGSEVVVLSATDHGGCLTIRSNASNGSVSTSVVSGDGITCRSEPIAPK
jgi:hypothetical protein